MLIRLARIPVRIARRVVNTLTGRDAETPPAPRQADAWEIRSQELPSGDSHPHSHDHDHDHEHPEPETKPETAAKPETKPEPETAATPEPAVEEVRPLTQVYPSDTPNPNAWKFTLDRKFLESGSLSFSSMDEAKDHGLARALFSLSGVASVFAVNDFITVTQDGSRNWTELSTQIIKVIQSHA